MDASRSVAVCRALLDPVHKEDYIQSITESYEEIRNEFYATIKDRDMLYIQSKSIDWIVHLKRPMICPILWTLKNIHLCLSTLPILI